MRWPDLPRLGRSLACLGASLGATALLAIAGLALDFALADSANARAEPLRRPPLRAEGAPARLRLVWLGDVGFGESYSADPRRTARLDRGGYGGALARLAPLLRSADLAVVNLETPLTRRADSPLAGRKAFVHWGDPERTTAALAELGVGVVSLANNHTMDQLAPGLFDTFEALAARGIDAVGAGPTVREAARPYRRELVIGPWRTDLALVAPFERTWGDFRFGAYAAPGRPGTYGPWPSSLCRQVAALHAETPPAWVVVFPHWGDNYRWRTAEQRELGTELLAAGAGLVVGHGAHAAQELERRDGRWVLYGIGNGAFLSAGRYGRLGAHSFSLAVALDVVASEQGLAASARLYFIESDNGKTGYQPTLLAGDGFAQAADTLLGQSERASGDPTLRLALTAARDELGEHLHVELGTLPSVRVGSER